MEQAGLPAARPSRSPTTLISYSMVVPKSYM